jgi:hypothetical protein
LMIRPCWARPEGTSSNRLICPSCKKRPVAGFAYRDVTLADRDSGLQVRRSVGPTWPRRQHGAPTYGSRSVWLASTRPSDTSLGEISPSGYAE